MAGLEEQIKKYIKITSYKEKKVVIRKVGRNASGSERILLYATAGVDLRDYAVCISSYNRAERNYQIYRYFYHFTDNKKIEEDSYICLFTDSLDTKALMNGQRIRTYHMMENGNILHQGDKVVLIKISEVSVMNVVED